MRAILDPTAGKASLVTSPLSEEINQQSCLFDGRVAYEQL